MIVIAPDKFRGTLTARQAAVTIADALRRRGVKSPIFLYPMADGGEGTGGALAGDDVAEISTGIRRLTTGDYVVTSADVIGHGSFADDSDPLRRSSAALGRAIADILNEDRSDSRIYVGIGGTATVDCGAGLLYALGARFVMKDGSRRESVPTVYEFSDIVSVDYSGVDIDMLRRRVVALCDVRASLLPDGEGLSMLSFARQKGVDDEHMPVLREAARCFKSAVGYGDGIYDGAGGGTGFALTNILGCEAHDGARMILNRLPVDSAEIECFITGEGRIDAQTSGGKVVAAVFERAAQLDVPAYAFGGCVEDPVDDRRIFSTMRPGEEPPASSEEARLRLWKTVFEAAVKL